MEYIRKDGTKVIVEGDTVQYGEGKAQKNVIGPNYIHGFIHGGYLSSFNNSFNDEFIGVESDLGDIITTKIGDIKDAYVLLKTKLSGINTEDIYELSRVIFETVDEYFDGISNVDKRLDYYYSEDYAESKNNEISNLKGTGAAACVERAALSQNLLKLLGINSFYKSSGILRNNKKEVHSYNLIEYNGNYYIFDTSIPNLIDNCINPLICEVNKETFDLLSAPIAAIGISVTTEHYNPLKNQMVTIVYDDKRERSIEIDPLGEKRQKHL